MEEQPSPASHGLILDRFVKKPFQISTKEDPLNFSPNSPFTWVEATVKAAAEQNPEMTGAEINSTMNPGKNPRYTVYTVLFIASFKLVFLCAFLHQLKEGIKRMPTKIK